MAQEENVVKQPALTRRQAQIAVERLYDILLSIEQHNRDMPSRDNLEAMDRWCVVRDSTWPES